MFCCWVIIETNRFGNSLCGHGLIGGFSVQYCWREAAEAEKRRREAMSGGKRVPFTRGRNIVVDFRAAANECTGRRRRKMNFKFAGGFINRRPGFLHAGSSIFRSYKSNITFSFG